METCQNCRTLIDEYYLDKELESLRDLTVDDFHVCAECVTVVPEACVECGGGVYVPRGADAEPDYCPACRSELLARTGSDPGWRCDATST